MIKGQSGSSCWKYYVFYLDHLFWHILNFEELQTNSPEPVRIRRIFGLLIWTSHGNLIYWKSFFLRISFWRLLSNDSCDLAKDISIDLCIHYPQQSLRIMDMWNWWRLQVELTYFDKSLKFDGESSLCEFFILETIFQWLVWLG